MVSGVKSLPDAALVDQLVVKASVTGILAVKEGVLSGTAMQSDSMEELERVLPGTLSVAQEVGTLKKEVLRRMQRLPTSKKGR